MFNTRNFTRLCLLIFASTLSHYAYSSDAFPARKNYPSVQTISMLELYQKRNDVIIVDTRSNYEHSTLHIKNSINIPISDFDFSSRVKSLYNDKKRTIVFYCNGYQCEKSYKAVMKARRFAKVSDALAFDGGIFEWTRQYPQESVLFEQSPVEPAALITDEEFEKHLLKPKAFLKRSNENCIVLDIRDTAQRTDLIFSGFEKSVSMDNTLTLDRYITDSKNSNKALCIYDAVGRQIRWFQYYLKQKNITNYYFLDGGAKAFFKIPYKQLHDS